MQRAPRSLTSHRLLPVQTGYRSKILIGVTIDFDYVCSTMAPRKSTTRFSADHVK